VSGDSSEVEHARRVLSLYSEFQLDWQTITDNCWQQHQLDQLMSDFQSPHCMYEFSFLLLWTAQNLDGLTYSFAVYSF